MTLDFLSGLAAILNIGWTLLTSVHIPGTNITPAALLIFVSLTGIVLRFLSNLFTGSSGSSSGSSSKESSK